MTTSDRSDAESKTLWKSLMDAAAAFFGTAEPEPLEAEGDAEKDALPSPAGMRLYKDAAGGGYRWFAWVSNKFRDRDNPPQIIEEAAHKEFVAALDAGTAPYPEAWLWHTPGTRWGQADWADDADGFLCMSGTVDKGMEDVAERLAAHGDLGVSHGFRYEYSDQAKEVIGWYRTFEISPLPASAAANVWTGMDVLRKEAATVGFKPEKREFLEAQLGKERVAALEGDTAGLRKALEAAGVDYKDLVEDAPPAPAAPQPQMTAKEIGEAAAAAIVESAAFKGLQTDLSAVKANADQVPAIMERLEKLEKSDDEKIASTFRAAVAQGAKGYRATEDGGNVVNPDDPAFKSATPMVDPGFLAAFRS